MRTLTSSDCGGGVVEAILLGDAGGVTIIFVLEGVITIQSFLSKKFKYAPVSTLHAHNQIDQIETFLQSRSLLSSNLTGTYPAGRLNIDDIRTRGAE
mmetsp:Transcript_24394/g.55689  ORF Transcript_24394/g.55689 Transcript_24394/m.55689 type:complete len:97 (-) Transcript_24394:76-366(-)